jgi:hypothetical protein
MYYKIYRFLFAVWVVSILFFLFGSTPACGQIDKTRMSVITPSERPSLNQESIDYALKIFDIKVPKNVNHPSLDMLIEDRGLTTYHTDGTITVVVGPNAFTSWGILGSTLAHELEVHCLQNVRSVIARDLLGLNGTRDAERAAYMHEIKNHKRFGLSQKEVYNVIETMEMFYPAN